MAIGELATRDFLRSELRTLQADLDERSQSDAGDRDSDAPRAGRSLDA
jgi:hypothetical protein